MREGLELRSPAVDLKLGIRQTPIATNSASDVYLATENDGVTTSWGLGTDSEG